MTILKENYSESFQEGKLFGGKSRQTSLQEAQRPLMTPDECQRLIGLRKNSSGDIVEAGSMLIFPYWINIFSHKKTASRFDDDEAVL